MSSEALSCCVLDIETAPIAEMLPAARAGRPRRGDAAARHGVRCASLITFVEYDGRVAEGSVRLLTFGGKLSESELLQLIDATLPVPDQHSLLATFNGRGWDLPQLRQRAMANWLFELERITAWNRADAPHRDLMLELSNSGAGRWQSLAAACASLSVPVKDLPPSALRSKHAVLLGNQCDAAATYLLYLHLRSLELGSPLLLATGWLALAEALLVDGQAPNHLAPYIDHPRIEVARAVLAANPAAN